MNKIPLDPEPAAVGSLPVEPSFVLAGKITFRRVEMKSQGGDFISKSVATDPDDSFRLSWANLPETDFETLRDFFLDHNGPVDSFIWQSARWMFKDETFESQLINTGKSGRIYLASIDIEKIPEICPVSHPTSS